MKLIPRLEVIGILLAFTAPLFGCADEPPVLQRAVKADSATEAQAPQLPPITPMNGTGPLSPPSTPSDFTLVVFGDSQGDNDSSLNRAAGQDHPTLRAILVDILQANPRPAFAVSLGDVIRGEPKKAKNQKLPQPTIGAIRSNLRYATCLAGLATIPVFNAPGNHELDAIIANNTERPDRQMLNAYHEVVGPTFGAFDYGNSLVIILNTEDLLPSQLAPLAKPGSWTEYSFVNQKQIDLLKATLDANTHKDHIFIGMHYPIHAKDNPDDELEAWVQGKAARGQDAHTQLKALFDDPKYPVSYVLASHQHLFYDHSHPIDWSVAGNLPENWQDGQKELTPFKKGDPPRYLVSGGAGATFHGETNPWNFHHYVSLRVSGPDVDATVHYIPPR